MNGGAEEEENGRRGFRINYELFVFFLNSKICVCSTDSVADDEVGLQMKRDVPHL